jgi:hypothetical protein
MAMASVDISATTIQVEHVTIPSRKPADDEAHRKRGHDGAIFDRKPKPHDFLLTTRHVDVPCA